MIPTSQVSSQVGKTIVCPGPLDEFEAKDSEPNATLCCRWFSIYNSLYGLQSYSLIIFCTYFSPQPNLSDNEDRDSVFYPIDSVFQPHSSNFPINSALALLPFFFSS